MSTVEHVYHKTISILNKCEDKILKKDLNNICEHLEKIIVKTLVNYPCYTFTFNKKENYLQALEWVDCFKTVGLLKVKKGFSVRLEPSKRKIWVNTLKELYGARVTYSKKDIFIDKQEINNVYEDVIFALEENTKLDNKSEKWYNELNKMNEITLLEVIDNKAFIASASKCLKYSKLDKNKELVIKNYIEGIV